MNLRQAYLLILCIQLTGVCIISAIRCYECDDDEGTATTTTTSCAQFKIRKSDYIKECNHTQGGCSLIIKGNKETRSCADNRLQDCRIANSIKYCFCFMDLCNDSEKMINPSDDEDLYDEGSGMIMLVTNKPHVITAASVGNNKNNTTTMRHMFFIITIIGVWWYYDIFLITKVFRQY